MFSQRSLLLPPHTPEGWSDKWPTEARLGPVIPSLFWASPPCSPVLAKPGLEEQGPAQGCYSQAKGCKMEARLARPRLGSPRGSHTRHWEPHCNLEMGICVFPNSSMFQSKFTPDTDKRGCGGSLHSKRNRRKENKENPRPQAPEGLQTFSQAKCSAKRGGSAFVAAARI